MLAEGVMLVKEKAFPANYNDSVLDILERASISGLKGVKILGSASIRSQQYSGDYDANDDVHIKSFADCANDIQNVIKRIREDCYITDFKIGEVPEWNVVKGSLHGGMYKAKHSKETQAALAAAAAKKAKAAIAAELAKRKDSAPLKSTVELARLREAVQSLYGRGMEKKEESQVLDFKLLESLAVLDKLKADKIISDAEYKGAERLLRNVDSPLSFIEASKGIRFHILRWKPSEVLEGVKEVRGYKILLEDALASGGMVKLDLIASVDNQFSEFSMIYNLFLGNKRVTPNKSPAEVQEALKEDIIYYNHRSPFKALKRAFSLAKMTKKYSEIELLLPILNSDLGRLYQIVGDLESLYILLEQRNPPVTEIKYNLDEMKARMGSIYSLKEFLDAEHEIIGRIESMQKMPIKTLKPAIFSLHTELQGILNESTIKKIKYIRR